MHFGLINSPQTKNTLVVSAISAIACGLIQSDWIFWMPGAVFGLLFAIANFQSKFQISLYTALSSAIYIGAVRIFFKASGNDLNYYLAGGLLAGVCGALTLALITKLISKTSLTFSNEFRSTIIGGITGIAFVHIIVSSVANDFGNEGNWSWPLFPIAFALWQIPVGWSLTTSIQPNSNPSSGPSTNAPG
jgi:hypothetical protein